MSYLLAILFNKNNNEALNSSPSEWETLLKSIKITGCCCHSILSWMYKPLKRVWLPEKISDRVDISRDFPNRRGRDKKKYSPD